MNSQDEVASTPSEAGAARRAWRLSGRYALPLALAAVVVVTAIANPRFLSPTNLFNILFQISTLGVVAAGQTLLLISGGLDLSVGANLSVAALVAALTIVATGSPLLGVLAGLVTATLIGAANGALVSTNRANPFIITLGTMTFLQGIAIVISGGSPINGAGILFDVFGLGSTFEVPNPAFVLLAVLLVVALVLGRSVLGRFAYALGGNEEAARLSGVPVVGTKITLYAANGFIVGIAAVLLTGILDSALPNMGTGYELRAIAAVVIGGTPLMGGRGSVWGTLGGVLLLGLVSNSMNLLGIGANYQNAVLGLIITAAVLLQKRS